jgi:hypothetical protein
LTSFITNFKITIAAVPTVLSYSFRERAVQIHKEVLPCNPHSLAFAELSLEQDKGSSTHIIVAGTKGMWEFVPEKTPVEHAVDYSGNSVLWR